ncbi:proline-rich receptor-like protein kinase PERK2 [Piliocolobus tephrosceles]|uniref:proline-rich receptor-like protein kinase PERK2 n=1 Tax=Piliocolobus tephrosceles TaxID=591936 RepID=UPI0013016693|nr:proline-rich receptor-like protein kinase PERK2 [Piliocolobus tephrosceles]
MISVKSRIPSFPLQPALLTPSLPKPQSRETNPPVPCRGLDFWNLALKQQPGRGPISLRPSFPTPRHIPNNNSEPSTLDSQSSTTLFLSSEEPGPSTAALPSPSSSSCEPQAFSPGPPVLPPLLPPLPSASAPLGSGASRRTGLYSVVASSPETSTRLVDWLPGCPSTTSPGTRGDDKERPLPVLAPAEGPERSRAPRSSTAGREEGTVDASTSPPPRARPAAVASLEAHVGDILVELRTMNGHLDIIARALTKLASSLGPQPEPLLDAPDAN